MKKVLSVALSLAMLAGLSAGAAANAEGAKNKVYALSATVEQNGAEEGWCFPSIIGGFTYKVEKGDVLVYDVKVVKKVDGICMGNIDFHMDKKVGDMEPQLKDFTQLKGKADNVNLEKKTDITKFADNKWYHREIDISVAEGYTLDDLQVMAYAPATVSGKSGEVMAYYDNVKIMNGDKEKIVIFTGDEENVNLETPPPAQSLKTAKAELVEDEVVFDDNNDSDTSTTESSTDNSKPQTGDVMPVAALALLLPASACVVLAMKKGKKQ